MNLRTHKSFEDQRIPDRQFGLTIVGPVVDDRGRAARQWCKERSNACINLVYDPEAAVFLLDNVAKSPEELYAYFQQIQTNVLIEATTLGFAEVVHCCRGLLGGKHKAANILYVEPLRYVVPHPSEKILLQRDFSLTDVVRSFSGVPGWIRRLTTERLQHLVFFLGFEGERLDQAIEQLIVNPENCSLVFGVPAFRPGWEMNAFANNIQRITESRLRGGVNFCGADNPAAVVNLLADISKTTHDSQDLFAVPIGTKPHAIGVALFAATHPNLGLIYDFPERKIGRSTNESTWHLFEATLT